MPEIVGWIGAILFAVCGAPQALKSVRDGHSRGVSLSFLLLWLGGELCFLYSTIAKFGLVSWLIFNYVGNLVFVLIILYFAFFPRNREVKGMSSDTGSPCTAALPPQTPPPA